MLIVEDIIAAGLSSRESWHGLAERPRRVAPAMLDIPACAPDALAALPPVKPGSRALAGAA